MITFTLSIPHRLKLRVPTAPGVMDDPALLKATILKSKIDFLNMVAQNITIEAEDNGDWVDMAVDSVDRDVSRDRNTRTFEQETG
ncbi:hypothetical protein [Streptomyces sp. SID3212]|uniref:hypothetical protein n=1 Tax=Streptomyces sp. SID3212 TaxID=2690259 RepID=UPI00136BAB34|nr:hypothetical protein [Streptomyces sp. SID3212]MYV58018.1 hypothetical protein [Streptomyces sp. SID3212]